MRRLISGEAAALLIGSLAALSLSTSRAIAAPPATMRAAVVSHGHLVMRSLPLPVPGKGQVRIAVRAAAVNPADWKMARMSQRMGPQPVLGLDAAGTIDALGPGVTSWRVGEAVIAITSPPHGSYAQYALASERTLAPKPHTLTFEEAAGIPIVGVTAWHALVDLAHVRRGERILIDGGAGGVGSAAVQIAKARGAYIITTARASNTRYLKSLGADEVIDYTKGPFERKVRNVDLVLEAVSRPNGIRAIRTLKPGGLLISLVGSIPASRCTAARIRCLAPHGSGKDPPAPILEHVVALANAGRYHVSIERVFPLGRAGEAWQLNRRGHTRGKLIIAIPR